MIIVGLMMGAIFSVITCIGAEMSGGGFGLGSRLTTYSSTLRTDDFFAVILILAILGILIYSPFVSLLHQLFILLRRASCRRLAPADVEEFVQGGFIASRYWSTCVSKSATLKSRDTRLTASYWRITRFECRFAARITSARGIARVEGSDRRKYRGRANRARSGSAPSREKPQYLLVFASRPCHRAVSG